MFVRFILLRFQNIKHTHHLTLLSLQHHHIFFLLFSLLSHFFLTSFSQKQRMIAWSGYLFFLSRALSKLPIWSGDVFRGIGIEHEQVYYFSFSHKIVLITLLRWLKMNTPNTGQFVGVLSPLPPQTNMWQETSSLKPQELCSRSSCSTGRISQSSLMFAVRMRFSFLQTLISLSPKDSTDQVCIILWSCFLLSNSSQLTGLQSS